MAINSKEKFVLLVGDLTQEGVTTKIKSLGHSYIHKKLFSSYQNWLAIKVLMEQLRNEGNLVAVFMQLTENSIFYFCQDDDFRDLMLEMLGVMQKVPSLAFIYQDNLNGRFSRYRETIDSYEVEKSDELAAQAVTREVLTTLSDAEVIKSRIEHHDIRLRVLNDVIAQQRIEQKQFEPLAKAVIQDVLKSGVEVSPYKRRVDLTLRINQFLDEIDNGIFLRLYVPNGRYQAEQLDGFLRLFEDYFQKVEEQPFSIDLRKTQHGLVYDFKSTIGVSNITDIECAMSLFENFMNLAQNRPDEAEAILVKTGVTVTTANQIIAKYTKKYQRLQMDSRHEYEQKKLSLRQQLEAEVFEYSNTMLSSLPEVPVTNLVSLAGNLGPVTIHVPNATVQTIIDSVINGDINYSIEDKQLIELFEKNSSRIEAISLKSELDQLKDDTSPEAVRKTAQQKISGFLYKLSTKIGDAAVKVGIDYVEKKLMGL